VIFKARFQCCKVDKLQKASDPMPIQYLIDNVHRCVIKVWMGEITLAEWRDSERQVMEPPIYRVALK